MDVFSKEEFNELASYTNFPAVSIYMRTHKAGHEVNEGNDRLKLKNHLLDIARKLDKDQNDRDFLQPAFDLLDDHDFWTHQSEGLALFLAPGLFKTYRMSYPFKEKSCITSRFYLSPMLQFCQRENRFYVLALSQAQVRLFDCNQFQINELSLDAEVPRNMDEALRMDEPEQPTQFRPAIGRGSAQGAVFYGHGGGEESPKEDIARFCKKVDNGLRKMIAGDIIPLIIASVDYIATMYRNASEYKHVFPHGIHGNPDQLKANELHQKAWEIIGSYFEKEKLDAIDRYKNLIGSEVISNNVEDIVSASRFSKVDVLFLSDEAELWGKFNESSTGVEVHKAFHEGDEDLLNRAAIDTLMNGGRVFLLDKNYLPDNARYAAAIYRYS